MLKNDSPYGKTIFCFESCYYLVIMTEGSQVVKNGQNMITKRDKNKGI